jgi:hypothetical protein
MIIDFNDKEQLKKYNVTGANTTSVFFSDLDDDFEEVTFKNFPSVYFTDVSFKKCKFEDCGWIEFSEGYVYDSEFKNISTVQGHYTDFHGCKFVDCSSEDAFFYIDSDGEIEGCTFENITASGEDGYIISCIYNSQSAVREISNCRFINCKVENEYDELVECRYMKHGFGNKTVYEDNIDYDTCVFENN